MVYTQLMNPGGPLKSRVHSMHKIVKNFGVELPTFRRGSGDSGVKKKEKENGRKLLGSYRFVQSLTIFFFFFLAYRRTDTAVRRDFGVGITWNAPWM